MDLKTKRLHLPKLNFKIHLYTCASYRPTFKNTMFDKITQYTGSKHNAIICPVPVLQNCDTLGSFTVISTLFGRMA